MRLARLALALVTAAAIIALVAVARASVDPAAPPVAALAGDPWTYVEVAAFGAGIWLVTEIGVAASSKRRGQQCPRRESERDHMTR